MMTASHNVRQSDRADGDVYDLMVSLREALRSLGTHLSDTPEEYPWHCEGPIETYSCWTGGVDPDPECHCL